MVGNRTVAVGHMFSKTPAGYMRINVCSNSGDFAALSPFIAGPCSMPDGRTAKRMENAWQFSKVYGRHLDEDEFPNEDWWEWSNKGFADEWAHRYPMGKGAIPAYTWYGHKKLGYLEARKQVYVPLYAKAIQDTPELAELKAVQQDLWLVDYDGYETTDDFATCLANPKRKLGHAFVVKALLDEDPTLKAILEE